MRIGVPKEIKTLEFRVGLTPGAAHSLVEKGHEVFDLSTEDESLEEIFLSLTRGTIQ